MIQCVAVRSEIDITQISTPCSKDDTMMRERRSRLKGGGGRQQYLQFQEFDALRQEVDIRLLFLIIA